MLRIYYTEIIVVLGLLSSHDYHQLNYIAPTKINIFLKQNNFKGEELAIYRSFLVSRSIYHANFLELYIEKEKNTIFLVFLYTLSVVLNFWSFH